MSPKMNLWNQPDKTGRIYAICGAKIQEEKHNQTCKTEVLQLPSPFHEIHVPMSKREPRGSFFKCFKNFEFFEFLKV